jgi:site-specific recombinase XerD
MVNKGETLDILQQSADEFLANLEASHHSLLTYRSGLRCFFSYQLPMDNDVLERFHARMMNDPRDFAPKTRAIYLIAARQFIRWLDAHDRLPHDFSVIKALTRLRSSVAMHRTYYDPKLPDPNLPKLLNYFTPQPDDSPKARLRALRNNAIMHVLYSTACRVSEVTSMTREQVRDGHATECAIKGKGEKTRTVFLDGPARRAIRAYLAERDDNNPALFKRHDRRDTGKPLCPQTVQIQIRQAARELRLQNNTTPHSFRHYVATDMLHLGVPIEMVQITLGHTSINTTRDIYAHTNIADLRKQIARYQRKRKQGLG